VSLGLPEHWAQGSVCVCVCVEGNVDPFLAEPSRGLMQEQEGWGPFRKQILLVLVVTEAGHLSCVVGPLQ
jgi:hypothetical protein